MISETYFPATDGEKSLPFVLLPGLGLSAWYLRPLASILARTSDVWVVGIGTRRGSLRTVEQMARAVCDWLKARKLATVHLLGHSFGAQICAAIAVFDPGLVRGIILVAPTVDPSARSYGRQVWRFVCDIPREPFRLVCYAALNYLGLPWRLLRHARAALKYPIELALPAINVRALVIHGGRDRVVSDVWAAAVAQLLPCAEFVTLPDQAHGVVFSAPAAVAHAVRQFAAGPGAGPVAGS